jgi:hypothetical protein
MVTFIRCKGRASGIQLNMLAIVADYQILAHAATTNVHPMTTPAVAAYLSLGTLLCQRTRMQQHQQQKARSTHATCNSSSDSSHNSSQKTALQPASLPQTPAIISADLGVTH